MASEVDICNRGLQKLGAARITSLTENSVAARACNVAYEALRDAELRSHPWSFALARKVLAPDSSAPAFQYSYQFTLPSDFLRLHPDYEYQEETDWVIEGRSLLTNDGDTLYLRYIRRVEDTTLFDALFTEALASRIAAELAEELTQSNTKKADAWADWDRAIQTAKKANAIEKRSAKPPTATWVSRRT